MDQGVEASSPEVHASWHQLRRGTTKIAFSLKELVSLTSDFSVKWAHDCDSQVIRTDRAKHLFVYRVTCHKKKKDGTPESDPNGHVVRLKFDFDKMKQTGTVADLDVRVTCSCVAPDTWVRMADGTEKMIKDMVPGDLVITHKGRARKVTHVTKRDARPGEMAWQVSVEGYQDPLILSEDHPMAVVRGHEECARGCGRKIPELTQAIRIDRRFSRKFVREHVVQARYIRIAADYSAGRALWRTAPALGKFELMLHPKPETGGVSADADIAVLAGYYAAEGSLYYKKFGSVADGGFFTGTKRNPRDTHKAVVLEGEDTSLYGVTYALHKKERSTLAADIISRVSRAYPNAVVSVSGNLPGEALCIRVHSSAFAKRMFGLVGFRSSSKRLSSEVFSWDLESRIQFLAAWALGDGHVATSLQSGATISRDLATQMATLLHSVGIPAALSHWDQKNRQRAYRISWSFLRHRGLVDAMWDRMQPEAQQRVVTRVADVESNGTGKAWGGGYLKTLKSAKIVDAPEVFYDLTVEEDESFIANGCLVHNCPAFLYWGPQWALATGDALYGAPRPKFQPPTDPKRNLFIICKHVKIIADRIGPALERLLDHHRNLKDRAQQSQNLKDVALEKQRAQQTVEDLSQDQDPVPDTAPQNPNAPEVSQPTQQGPVKTWSPEETGDLTLPGQQPALPPPAAPPAAAPVPPKAPVVPPGPKGKLVAPNLTVHDEDEGEPIILPGNKGKLVMDQLAHPNVFVHDDEDDSTTILPGRQPRLIRRDETTTGQKLPPNLTLHDDDEDDTVRINSALRRLAGLVVAAVEPVPAGRLGALVLAATPGRLGQLVVAAPTQTSGPTL